MLASTKGSAHFALTKIISVRNEKEVLRIRKHNLEFEKTAFRKTIIANESSTHWSEI
jgi:hypothetical protein